MESPPWKGVHGECSMEGHGWKGMDGRAWMEGHPGRAFLGGLPDWLLPVCFSSNIPVVRKIGWKSYQSTRAAIVGRLLGDRLMIVAGLLGGSGGEKIQIPIVESVGISSLEDWESIRFWVGILPECTGEKKSHLENPDTDLSPGWQGFASLVFVLYTTYVGCA